MVEQISTYNGEIQGDREGSTYVRERRRMGGRG